MATEVKQQIEESEAAAEAIQPSTETRTWVIEGPDAAGNPITREYIQEELSFFNKQEFITLLTKYVERFISGELGVSLTELFQGDLRSRVNIPTDLSPEAAESMVKENESLIMAVIRVVQSIPELQHQIFLLSLGVPRNERDWAVATMTGPVSRGGLNDDQGFAILKTFVTQNAQAIRDFFAEKGRDFVEHVQRELDLGPEEEVEEEQTEPSEETETTTEPEPIATPGGTPSSISSPDIPD
jgi:hypothetical protein